MSLTAIRASLSLLYDITATSFDCKSQNLIELIRSDPPTSCLRILLGSSIRCIVSIHRSSERDGRYRIRGCFPLGSTGLQVRPHKGALG